MVLYLPSWNGPVSNTRHPKHPCQSLHGLTAGKPTWGYEIRAEMPWKKCLRKWQQAKQNCTGDMWGSPCHCTNDHHFLSPTRGSCPASSKIFSMAAETSPSLCSVLLLFHRRIRLKLGTSTIRLRPKKLISLLSPFLISLSLSLALVQSSLPLGLDGWLNVSHSWKKKPR